LSDGASNGKGSLIRLLVVDDHKIVREGLVSLLSEQQDIEVIGEAGNGREAITLASTLHPDVIIMDISMPLMNGDEATRQIKKMMPEIRIIALSMFEEEEMLRKMYSAGAEKYVLKTAPSAQLLAAIRGH
jgi:DNA-binding NarL/FixJ family response regulator